MSKRILHIVPTLGRGGAETQMGLLARGLATHGGPHGPFDVSVCALQRGGPLEDELTAAGVHVAVIGRRRWFDPGAYRRLRRHVAQWRPDLIHTWTPAAGAYGHAVAAACGIPCRLCAVRHLERGSRRLALAVQRYVTRRSARVVVNSPAVGELCRQWGLPKEKVRTIPNGVAESLPGNTTRRQLLAELGLPGDCRLVATVGSLRPRKRIKDAIWTADSLKVIRDDVHLLIVGDGPHRNRLMKFRDQVVIRDKVHFLGHRDDVLRVLPHVDVFWSPGESAGQSGAILEAMAHGVPVVVAATPDAGDLIVHETTGFVAPIGERTECGRHTNRLLDDAELAARIGEAGRAHVLREFGAEKMVERYAVLYTEILDGIGR